MPKNRDRDPDLFDALRFSESEDSLEPTPLDPLIGPGGHIMTPAQKPNFPAAPAAVLKVAKPAVVALREAEPKPEADELVVELPLVFERPHSESLDQYDSTDVITRHRLDEGPPPPAPVRQGLSKRAAVGIALLTQVLTIGVVVGVAFLFPEPTAELFRSAAASLDPLPPPDPEIVKTEDENASRRLRVELIELEDRAVSQGERIAFSKLTNYAETLSESDSNFTAAQAGLRRVEHFYATEPFGEPEPLDARSIYAVATERDLPQSTVIQVLRDDRQPVELRRRAAWLLAGNASSSAKKALYGAIRNDADLSVVRQAFESFRGVTGYPETVAFDAAAIELWWARNEAAALGRSGPPETNGEAVNIGPEP
ncbi:MAG: hypothetical protein ACI8UO_003045 [Verrucomicrobiales bacterium]|jgi:hypothetical protein